MSKSDKRKKTADIVEISREELKAMQESEKIFKSITENAADSIFIKDIDRRYTFVNKTMQKIIGIPKDRLLGKTPEEIFGPEQGEIIKEVDDRTFSGETVHETRFIQIGDKEYYFDTLQSPLSMKDGEVTSIMGIVRDISKQKNVEEALQESEQRYRNILENSSFGISAYDETGQCILANRALAEIIGAPDINHIIGQNMYTIRSWKPSGMLDLAEDSLKHGSWKRKTLRFKTTFGKDIWLDCTFVPYRQRRKPYLMLIAENVTNRVLSEKSLMESEARYRALVESTSDWVWEVDEKAIYTYASPKVQDILGYTPEEVLGKTPFHFMSPDEAKSIADIFAPISTAHKPFHNLKNTNLHKNGYQVVLETSGIPIFDNDGIFRGYRGIDRDITERYTFQEALQQSKDELEIRVRERTRELQVTNEKLLIQIESRRLIEEHLRKSEEKFRSAALCTADLIWQGDVRDNSLIWYGDIDGSLGYEPMEFPRTISGHMENIHPEDRDGFMKNVEKAVASGEDFYAEYRIRCKDGTYRIWNERGKPIVFDNGKAVEWVGSVTDTTQEKRDRDNLITSADEYKRISLELLEKNTALKVLMEQRINDQSAMEQHILQNIKSLVHPYIGKLKNSKLGVEERAYISLVESNLEEIISPFARKLTSRQMNFSVRELEIADLIRSGKQGKEIARILNLSPETINTHRKAIRRKLGLTGKGSNLRSTLISISER